MTALSSPVPQKPAMIVPPQLQKKLRALVAKAPYEAPELVSFPIDRMTVADAMGLTGNG
jgi:hypothetical protein